MFEEKGIARAVKPMNPIISCKKYKSILLVKLYSFYSFLKKIMS